jgi:hypothetical protein
MGFKIFFRDNGVASEKIVNGLLTSQLYFMRYSYTNTAELFHLISLFRYYLTMNSLTPRKLSFNSILIH